MDEPMAEGHPATGDGALRHRLLVGMVGRLALSLAVLGAALLLTARSGGGPADPGERGLYAMVVLALLATIVFAALFPRLRRVRLFGGLQIGVDVALVSALVHFSGGAESIFAFLYVPVTVYAALLLGRGGAYAATAAAAVAYGLVLFLPEGPAGPVWTDGSSETAVAHWGFHAGALLLVALLASQLSRERERAGLALRATTRDFRTLQQLHERTVGSLTSGLLTLDRDDRITSFNPEAERITGFGASEVIGRRLEQVIPGAREAVLAATDTGREVRPRARLRFAGRDGELRHLGLASSPLRTERGDYDGHVVIFQDVTQVVEMEQELRRQERMAAVGELAAHLAHEIRNPLASISGSVQMLEGGSLRGSEEERSRLMAIVLREVDRLNGLIVDFLQYARPAPPKAEPVQVAAVVRDLLDVFESVRPESVRIVDETPEDLWVRVDEDQLRQLLWNLGLNAVQAMPDGGRLHLSAVAVDAQAPQGEFRNGEEGGHAWAEILVVDDGTGMSEETLERVFEPFFTTKKDGTGLGLATVHRVVESNGGHLGVESAPGVGSTFRIRLPRAEAPA